MLLLAGCNGKTEELTAQLEAAKAECKTYSYNEIARNPDDYLDKPAKLRGKVIQIQETKLLGSTYYVMRVNITKGKYSWSDTVYATYFPKSGEDRILTDDIITMWGTLQGTETYTTVLGASVTIPKISVSYVTVG